MTSDAVGPVSLRTVLASSILSSICGELLRLLRGGVSSLLVADASLDVLLVTLLEGASATGSRCLFLPPGASANTLTGGIELCSFCNLLLLLPGLVFLTEAFFFLLLGSFNA